MSTTIADAQTHSDVELLQSKELMIHLDGPQQLFGAVHQLQRSFITQWKMTSLTLITTGSQPLEAPLKVALIKVNHPGVKVRADVRPADDNLSLNIDGLSAALRAVCPRPSTLTSSQSLKHLVLLQTLQSPVTLRIPSC